MPYTDKNVKKLYFVGIKGVAVAGLAIMSKELGYEVSGSDVKETFITDALLNKEKINFHNGFAAENIKKNKPDIVIIGAAHGANNPEVKIAKSMKIPTATQSEMLGKLMAEYDVIGVAGIHGKTTTTSMLTLILQDAGFSPSYSIGTSEIPGLVSSAHIGEGKYFIVEADEYKKSETNLQPKFLDFPIKYLIVTSIEMDHPDIYPSAEHIYQVFYQLTSKIPRNGSIIACSDWPLVRRLVSRSADRKCVTYGFNKGAEYQIIDVKEGLRDVFSLSKDKKIISSIELGMPGRHNMLNAVAAYLMAKQLGVKDLSIFKTLKNFKGPKRRFEYLGEINGAQFFDDYAHHPTALNFLIDTVKKKFPTKRITLVFQPHTYSRTGKLLKEFAESLKGPDRLLILNIWASAREKSGMVTIKDLLNEIRKYRKDVEFRSSLGEVASYLSGTMSKEDVILLVGAGDVYKIYEKLAKKKY